MANGDKLLAVKHLGSLVQFPNCESLAHKTLKKKWMCSEKKYSKCTCMEVCFHSFNLENAIKIRQIKPKTPEQVAATGLYPAKTTLYKKKFGNLKTGNPYLKLC